MTVEYQPFEDVSPVKDEDFSAIAMLVFVGVPCSSWLFVGPASVAVAEDTIAVNSLMKEMPWREVSWVSQVVQELLLSTVSQLVETLFCRLVHQKIQC